MPTNEVRTKHNGLQSKASEAIGACRLRESRMCDPTRGADFSTCQYMYHLLKQRTAAVGKLPVGKSLTEALYAFRYRMQAVFICVEHISMEAIGSMLISYFDYI